MKFSARYLGLDNFLIFDIGLNYFLAILISNMTFFLAVLMLDIIYFLVSLMPEMKICLVSGGILKFLNID